MSATCKVAFDGNFENFGPAAWPPRLTVSNLQLAESAFHFPPKRQSNLSRVTTLSFKQFEFVTSHGENELMKNL